MRQMIFRRMTFGLRAAMMLAVVMMICAAPSMALAQNYKLDGDYVKFMKYVKLNPDEAEQYVETTEAAAGETVTASIDADKIPQGKYFTGVYSSQDVSLTTDWDGATFTMPAKNVTVEAALANQEDYTIDLTSATAVIPMKISSLLSYMEVGGKSCSVYDKDYNWFLDLNVDGINDLEVKSTFDEATQDYIYSLELLSGNDVYKTRCSFALNITPPDQYKSLIFKFNNEPAPVRTLQDGWISLSGNLTYTGQPIEPTVTVMDGISSVAVTVKYSNNTNAGEATVTVTANADGYNGSASKTFTITPKEVTVESGIKVSSVTNNGTTILSVDASNAVITGALNDDKLSITGVGASLQNGSTEVCNLDYTKATLMLGGKQTNNYVLATQGNQATAKVTASTETVTNPDGSQTIVTSLTPETDGSAAYTVDKDGNATKTSGSSGDTYLFRKMAMNNITDFTQLGMLIAQGDETNVLVNTETKKNAQGEVTATSTSLTVKQTGDSDPTQIAICAGGGVNPDAPTSGKCGGYMTWVVSANAGSSVYDVLTISGEGKMDDMWSGSPWETYQKQIKSVTIKEGVTSIGDYAFNYCSSLTSVSIPASVTSIGNFAFSGCSSLASVEIPKGVSSIGKYAFNGCSNLTSIDIPASVTSIGSYAFSGCSSLKSVTIPASVTNIGSEAFAYSGVDHVYVTVPQDKALKVTIKGVNEPVEPTLTDGKVDIIDCLFADLSEKTGSRGLTLEIVEASTGGGGTGSDNGGDNPSGTCGDGVRWELSKSKGSDDYDVLTISGEGEMSTGPHWYDYRNQIKTVIIEEGVTSIGNDAFNGCSNLTSIDIPASVTSIGDYAFNGCSNLTSIDIPASVTSIGDYAFNYCSSLESVTIPEGVTSIGVAAFGGCSSLTSVTIPASVTSMGQGAFTEVSKNTTAGIYITAAEGCQLTAIGKNAFSGANASIDLSNCTQLEAIGGECVFNYVTGDVTLPPSVTSICQFAFGNQYSTHYPGKHVYIDVPSGKKLKVMIAGVTDPVELESTDGKVDIIDCLFADPSNRIASRALTLTLVNASTGGGGTGGGNGGGDGGGGDGGDNGGDNPKGTCGKNVTWELSKSENSDDYDVLTISGNGDMEKGIYWSAFYKQIKTVIIKDGVTSISSMAFLNLVNLTSVIIPASVTSIGGDAFHKYLGEHVYVTVPDGKKLNVTLVNKDNKLITITPDKNGMADIISCLFGDLKNKINSLVLTLEIVEASTGDDNGGGSASGQGQEPSTREKNDRAATTMTVNYETKKETGEAGSGKIKAERPYLITRKHHDDEISNFNDDEIPIDNESFSRAATAEEEQEDDEIEIVSGQEYELLHDGYIVLNFYTPDAPITVKSIVFRRPGDANNDGYVDAADLVEMINAKNGKTSERFNLTNADINRDGEIKQDDIDAVVKIIMDYELH